MLIEFRIRTIYALKSLIYTYLQNGHCSPDSAMILLEICNCSLEECEHKLTFWFHLEELVNQDYLLKLMNYF